MLNEREVKGVTGEKRKCKRRRRTNDGVARFINDVELMEARLLDLRKRLHIKLAR